MDRTMLGSHSMPEKTIHVVYPHRELPIAPDVIGRHVGAALSGYARVRFHPFHQIRCIRPRPGDVLIGHAYPCAWSTLRWSMRQPGWGRRILLQPFSLDEREHGHLDALIDQCDLFLAITGDHWLSELPHSRFARWAPKIRQLDLGLENSHFPPIKTRFNPPGQRKLLYIGNDHPGKGLDYLDCIAQMLKTEITWLGPRRSTSAARYIGLKHHGFMDWSHPQTLQLLAGYDFLVMAGSFDACPTTVIEALAWGLLPVCTPTTGYANTPGVVNIPSGDVAAAVAILCDLQNQPEAALERVRTAGRLQLSERFKWSRFEALVCDAVHSSASPPLMQTSKSDWAEPYKSQASACSAALLRTLLPPGWFQAINPRVRQ
ncbi:MAG: hypothetical protein ORN28_11100 [Rhodoferax sp.]|nr:hypothetical protein [Rhodoferax sp.]